MEKRRARQNSFGKAVVGKNEEFNERMRRLRDLIQKEQSLTQANQEINTRLSTMKEIGVIVKENKRSAENGETEQKKREKQSSKARPRQSSNRAVRLPLIR